MPYPELMVAPMRQELTRVGVAELRTADDVDKWMASKEGTALLVINSVCGCAAGAARPAVSLAMQHAVKPDRVATVFAGQDTEATAAARRLFVGYRPSSPSIGLLKDGEPVFMLERHQIEGRSAADIAADLRGAFDRYCATDATVG